MPTRGAQRTTPELTVTELVVLALLADGPRSGYDLMKLIDGSVGYFWSPAKSRIYSILPRLGELGLASAREVAQRSRPDKQLWRLTAKGRRAVEAWLADPHVEPDTSRNPILLKLFLGAHAPRETLVAMVEERRRLDLAQLVEYEEIERRIERGYGYLALRFGILRVRATIAWAEETLAALRADA